MISKRDLGIGYLLGTGIGLGLSFITLVVFQQDPVILSVFEAFTALLLAITFLYVGNWLMESDLADNHIWAVARWSALGMSVPAIALVIIVWGRIQPTVDYIAPSLAINNIAAGGVAGILVGSIVELHKEHNTTQELNQKNLVMNRVLRHNIRNDMNIILGYAQRLEAEVENAPEEIVRPIKHKAAEVVDLSRSARRIEEVKDASGNPVEVTSIIREHLRTIAAAHPNVTIETDLPERAWVFADSMLKSVLENVIENAIEHNDKDPALEITVRESDEWVDIEIADNGPGIPAQEREVLLEEDATPLRHGNGLGLWLVKWFVDSYGGDLLFKSNDPHGSIVTLRLPASNPQEGTDETMLAGARNRATAALEVW